MKGRAIYGSNSAIVKMSTKLSNVHMASELFVKNTLQVCAGSRAEAASSDG